MPIWVVICEADWLDKPSIAVYPTFEEAVYDTAWLSFGSRGRRSTFTVAEAEVNSGCSVTPTHRWPSGPWERNRDT